jgi:hypothetical protein
MTLDEATAYALSSEEADMDSGGQPVGNAP